MFADESLFEYMEHKLHRLLSLNIFQSLTDGMKHETNSNDSGVFVKLRVVLTF